MKKTLTFFLFLFFIFTLLPLGLNNNASASLSGDWFITDFNTMTDGIKYVNESVGGDQWLYINATGGNPDGTIDAEDVYRIGTNHYTNFEVKGNFQDISINFSWVNWNSGVSSTIYFYSSSGVEIFNILLVYNYEFYLRKSTSTIYLGSTFGHDKGFWVNTTYCSNGTMKIYIKELNKIVYLNYGTEEYIRKVTFTQGNDAHHLLKIRHFRVSDPLQMYPWEVSVQNLETLGYVGYSTTDTNTNIGSSTSVDLDGIGVVLEQRYRKDKNIGILIQQFAFSISTTTDIDDLDLYLYINDDLCGGVNGYNSIINGCYIYYWENINKYIDEGISDIIFEILVVGADGKYISWYSTHSNHDIDNDGFVQYRYTDGAGLLLFGGIDMFHASWLYPYQNGQYDGLTTSAGDLVYQIWFTSSFDPIEQPWWVDWKYDPDIIFTNKSLYTNLNTTIYDIKSSGYFLLEQKYNKKYTDNIADIKQVGLALDNLTGYTDNITDIYLKVNGVACGSYGYRVYHEDDYYIYVWTDLTVDVSDRNYIVYEWLIDSPTGGNVAIMYATDTDNDGYSGSKWYNGTDLMYDYYFDGQYNAKYSNPKDIVYMFFYDDGLIEEGEEVAVSFFDAPEIKLIIAVVIIVVLTLTPLICAVGLSAKGHFQNIEIPSLVYVGFFFLGMIITVVLGYLDSWIFAVVFVGLILALIILWIQRKNTSS